MNTILMIPTGEGVGLTSACLGLIYALDCNGIKAGFLKPFSQELPNQVDRTTSLFSHLFQGKTVTSISHEKVLQRLALGERDELLEEAVSIHRNVAANYDVIIVEGLLPNAQDHFATELNAALAQALDAKVVLVSTADVQNPRRTAEKIEAHLHHFGGVSSNRTAGVLFMRTRGLPEETAQIPLTIDPSLRLNTEIAAFSQELQRYNRNLGTTTLPIIGLVPFSNTLSVPRTLDIASIIEGDWIHQGEARHRRILHSSLIASSIEYELNKFVAGELIISASERTDVLLASSLATSNGIPLAGLVLTERKAPNPQILDFCQHAIKQGLPILHTQLNTLETAHVLQILAMKFQWMIPNVRNK